MHLRLRPLPLFAGKAPADPPGGTLNSPLLRNFEDSLAGQLRSLNHDVGASFSFCSRAVEVLSSAHRLLEGLLSDHRLAGADEAASGAYLSNSVKLLDVCNAISEQVNRLRHGRLLVLLAVQLMSSPAAPENLRKGREILRQWESYIPKCGVSAASDDLARDLVRSLATPKQPATPLARAVFAVEAVSALIAGFVISFFSGGGSAAHVAGVATVPREFAWGEAFNKLRAALSSSGHGGAADDVTAAVKRCLSQMDGEAAGVEKKTAEELARAAERMTECLDSLGGAAESLFREALRTRNAALGIYRLQPTKCSTK